MAMLEIKDLQVYYGMIQAIKGVSFEVNQGEVIALIGANGAGKTTILHTITGLLAPKARILEWALTQEKIKMRSSRRSARYTTDFHDWRNVRTRWREP